MTTGFVSIKLPSGSIEGNFINGVLTDGTIVKDAYMTYIGTFDEAQKLHGANCREITQCGTITNERIGEFLHGEFLRGTSNHFKETLIGEFRSNSLTKGKKITNNAIYEGAFSLLHLEEGTISFKDSDGNITEKHEGKFWQGRLYDGRIIAENYKAEFVYEKNILVSCTVQHSGNLAKLNRVQFMLLCCSGLYCNKAYDFYVDNFSGLTIKQVLESKHAIVEMFNLPQMLGYKQIASNLEIYTEPVENVRLENGPVDIFDYRRYCSHY